MIDYFVESEKYKPKVVKTLLIGEAPPPDREHYFYLPAKLRKYKDISKDNSLPATIFNHYFHKIPTDTEEYKKRLEDLCKKGIFLIDICDEPLKIRDRNCPGQVNHKNLKILIENIPTLRDKIKKRIPDIDDKNIIFLLARKHYINVLKKYFPNSIFYHWIEFRIY